MTARKRSRTTSGAGATEGIGEGSARPRRARPRRAQPRRAQPRKRSEEERSQERRTDERRRSQQGRGDASDEGDQPNSLQQHRGRAENDVASEVESQPTKPAPKRGTTRRTPVFDPSRLDRTVIALPLVERFKEQVAARYAGTPPEKRRYPVVIDLNLDYHDGRDVARREIIDEIAQLLTSDASGNDSGTSGDSRPSHAHVSDAIRRRAAHRSRSDRPRQARRRPGGQPVEPATHLSHLARLRGTGVPDEEPDDGKGRRRADRLQRARARHRLGGDGLGDRRHAPALRQVQEPRGQGAGRAPVVPA